MTSAAAAALAAPSSASGAACSAGARTLSQAGDHVYPDTGNGGYASVHTDVHMRLRRGRNDFLPGNHVDLTDVATQCLTEFSLDFERSSADADVGPDMSVGSVTVNGQPADFRFVRPTYPGDPNGPDDPDPRAHQAGQNAVVGGPDHNPLPPACSPELPPDAAGDDAADGTQCPANKLVITPAAISRPGPSSSSRSPTPGAPACTVTATAPPRAGSARTTRPATAGSSPPSRWAPRTGCRSTTTRARSRPTTSTTP